MTVAAGVNTHLWAPGRRVAVISDLTGRYEWSRQKPMTIDRFHDGSERPAAWHKEPMVEYRVPDSWDYVSRLAGGTVVAVTALLELYYPHLNCY